MTFLSGATDHYSHRVRIVLAEKGVTVDLIELTEETKPTDLVEINPYNTLPTLVDRELVLYQPNIMMEYLDERFPHPPLLPVYPVARAQSRLLIYRIERDWSPLADRILGGEEKEATLNKLRKELRDSLVGVAAIFEEAPFFMSEEFSLVDCCVVPLLWRLPLMGIELPIRQIKPMAKYMERMFERESFQASLTDQEREMR
ncbi:MAG TPA: glutathione S-transferase N-terminal domain-containing protein [Pseudomonadales bacterium]|nr:glutathione S-transferase N-terminal domain-containing protein [Pseudomonadales bacterium]HMW15289.1 glutathione S-transferase N-terminal domain-containing protein [Pseudomonadales bacterium]HMW83177.1 glutathione S-transferase N-terminal domain-containing protein [Pseudomonadales bacterium]HMY96544.1 glutathione S-transferase N-terminal domain-containing protein [Pseudomonadales bacterium]HMZ70587.1 glutathione S-transferase N-terminal domain-containing protein [Pseudomonadales bacterium]